MIYNNNRVSLRDKNYLDSVINFDFILIKIFHIIFEKINLEIKKSKDFILFNNLFIV